MAYHFSPINLMIGQEKNQWKSKLEAKYSHPEGICQSESICFQGWTLFKDPGFVKEKIKDLSQGKNKIAAYEGYFPAF